ncbi:extracellular solute-binding protein [Brachybacterium sp. HMSC06H03]|uniref:extracellular solute-binding protein n=1 Tax=Brachybacterium sp. HMSC06H03 TaxID=1581127 RepID=UPI001FEE9522|nr:extracellular solute-binding protein [Brachybacterium sp. HMSC06H03]
MPVRGSARSPSAGSRCRACSSRRRCTSHGTDREYEGTPYAIPKDVDTIALWFNRDLLHRAGVDEPTGSWSWQEYRDASEAVTRALGNEQIWGNPAGVANQARGSRTRV